jgi:hypothetical protein
MPVDVEERTLVRMGAWISVLYKAFTPYDQSAPAFDPYETSILAAKAGILLSSIRSLPVVIGKQFDVYRKLARLKSREMDTVLKDLQDIGAVAINTQEVDGRPAIHSRMVKLLERLRLSMPVVLYWLSC